MCGVPKPAERPLVLLVHDANVWTESMAAGGDRKPGLTWPGGPAWLAWLNCSLRWLDWLA